MPAMASATCEPASSASVSPSGGHGQLEQLLKPDREPIGPVKDSVHRDANRRQIESRLIHVENRNLCHAPVLASLSRNLWSVVGKGPDGGPQISYSGYLMPLRANWFWGTFPTSLL